MEMQCAGKGTEQTFRAPKCAQNKNSSWSVPWISTSKRSGGSTEITNRASGYPKKIGYTISDKMKRTKTKSLL